MLSSSICLGNLILIAESLYLFYPNRPLTPEFSSDARVPIGGIPVCILKVQVYESTKQKPDNNNFTTTSSNSLTIKAVRTFCLILSRRTHRSDNMTKFLENSLLNPKTRYQLLATLIGRSCLTRFLYSEI